MSQVRKDGPLLVSLVIAFSTHYTVDKTTAATAPMLPSLNAATVARKVIA